MADSIEGRIRFGHQYGRAVAACCEKSGWIHVEVELEGGVRLRDSHLRDVVDRSADYEIVLPEPGEGWVAVDGPTVGLVIARHRGMPHEATISLVGRSVN